jgi:polysaccharide pyruvyl transferase WcaK-like protein
VDHYDDVGPETYEVMTRMAEAFAERTGRSYRQKNNLISAGHAGQLKAVLDLYASADLVLTSRLHGCIIALAMGRKVLAVSGDRKVESFMEAAGLRDWVCDLDEIDRLPRRLQALPSQIVPTQFVDRARVQNRAVATHVRRLLAENALGRPEYEPVVAGMSPRQWAAWN